MTPGPPGAAATPPLRSCGRAGPAALLLVLAAAGAGCAGPERTAAPLPDSVYVPVMARLSAVAAARSDAEDPLGDEEADSLRKAVLREHGVRPEELEEHARSLGDEPGRMRRLWERIVAASDSLRGAGWPEREPEGGR